MGVRRPFPCFQIIVVAVGGWLLRWLLETGGLLFAVFSVVVAVGNGLPGDHCCDRDLPGHLRLPMLMVESTIQE